jgi:hypothetical protein
MACATAKQAAKSMSNRSPLGRPPRIRLDSLIRVRTELAKLYREGRDGERDPAQARQLASILGLIAKVLTDSELETRLETLEKALAERGAAS